MVLFVLKFKAELEGIAKVSVNPTACLCINVANPLSDYEVRENVVIDPTEFVEQDQGSRESPHHFQLKGEGNPKPATLTVLSEKEAKSVLKKNKRKDLPRDYTTNDSGTLYRY